MDADILQEVECKMECNKLDYQKICYNRSMNDLIKHKLELLPDSPGCYLHKNKYGKIIYVGKAKNLRNRVRSYFRGAHDTKTEALVAEIADFEFIVTDSNIEALLLEINLIQENKPRYNIMLKDDKSYPFIKITKERHPRLLITRQIKKDGGQYFGPYPDVGAANQTLKLLERLYPFRKCKLPENKYCLYYHLGQCLAHGDNMPSLSDYDKMAKEVAQFLTGHDDKIIKEVQDKMKAAAGNLEFEKAAEYRDVLQSISTLRTKQRVMAHDLQNRDVFGYYVDKGWMCVQVFFVRQGKLIERNVNLFPYYNDAGEDFLTYIGQLLGIPTPVRIEAFDNSNIMGTSPVSAMVVFENGVPNKKEYRKYKINTVEGPDDYASMREVLQRRYSRVLRDGLTPPDLIIIDGGQGQVNVAKQVIEQELGMSIPIAGLQKNDKHQTHELLFGNPLEVVELPRNSQEFFLLHRIQDEVHRFAIEFHRQVRSKNSFSSKLDGIEGLGPKRKQTLMKHFKSIGNIQSASLQEIAEAGVPYKVAEKVKESLSSKDEI